jgi:non-ribosomal peptide synthetase component E (peptide arylation enzyme)
VIISLKWKEEIHAMNRRTHREIIKGWHPYTEEEINKYVSKGYWKNLRVCDLLDRNASLFPDKLAVADERTEVSWKQLQLNVNRMAFHLIKAGIKYGDFFVLQMANVVEFYYLFLALNRIGAIPVMSLPRHRTREIDHMLKLHEASGICVMVGENFDTAVW